jgi:phage gp45-like
MKQRKTLGSALNGVDRPHRKDSYVGKVSTTSNGGKSISVTNMNNSKLRNLVPITPYGIASSPPIGLMAYVLIAGDTSKDGIVGVYDPDKPQCRPGDSMMYSSGGASVHCNGGTVLLNNRNVLAEIDNLRKEIDRMK